MEVCVFGIGAVGGHLAARLAESQAHRVSVVGRGAHLQAIRENGLELTSPEGSAHVRFAAVEDQPQRLPPQDIVFVTLKAHSLPAAAESLSGLLKPNGHAVFVTNGVPWWWNHGLQGAAGPAKRVDPNGDLWTKFGPARALGCVVYSANEVIAPGKVLHRGNNRWTIGEPTNEVSSRATATVELMQQARLGAEVSTDLRHHIWTKLLRNTPFNPLGALTRLAADQFAEEPRLAVIAQSIMDEVWNVARAQGWELAPQKAIDIVTSGGAVSGKRSQGVKGSMLQDVLAGRSMELEALVGQVQEFAREHDVPTPTLDCVYALIRGLDLSVSQGQ
jgi:2-dehydropantoate 2-reductase